MKEETLLKKLIKRVDEICDDSTGADKPYKDHCKKWGRILLDDFREYAKKHCSVVYEQLGKTYGKYK